MLLLGFSANNTPMDLAIKLVERGLWHHLDAPRPLASHAFIEREHNGTPGLGIEATPTAGVHQFPATAKDPRRETLRYYYLPVSEQQEDAIWSAGLGYIARRTPYDWPGIACSLWYVLTGRRADAFDRSPDVSTFCSQVVVDMLRAGGVPVEMQAPGAAFGTFVGVPSNVITPSRLEKWALRHGQRVP